MFSDWEDSEGRTLGSDGTVAAAVQVRIVDESGAAQSATIYPEVTNGRSDYSLPLWPFTQAMEPHVGTYTIEWRFPGAADWEVIDTMTMDVRLPEATEESTLSYSDGVLTGTGWAFDRSTNIGGTFNVVLEIADAQGNARPVMVRARFFGTRFTITDAALADAGASVGAGYTISATPTGGKVGAISVTIPGNVPAPSAQPSTAAPTTVPSSPPAVEPTADPTPSASPEPEPTADPTPSASPEPEPTADPTPSASPEPEPTADPTPSASPEPEPTADPTPSASPEPEPTADPTPTAAPTEVSPTASPQSPSTPITTPAPGTRPPGGTNTGFDRLNEGVDVDPLVVRDTGGSAGQAGSNPSPQQDNTEAVQGSADDTARRPANAPISPVRDPGELGPDNAGSLSGTRQGTAITLIFPSSKVTAGDWVAVFVFPGATTPGWVQVDADNSVSIDISTLEPGSYKIAVGDRDSQLLGWAQLEIAQTASARTDGAGITLITGDALTPSGPLGADGWKLIGAGMLLVLGAVSFVVLARPTLIGTWTRINRR